MDDVTDTAKDPIRMETCAQVINKDIGIEQYLAGYRYGHGR